MMPLVAHASRNAAAVIVLPMSVKMKLVCESGRRVAEIRERLHREVAHRLVAGRFFLDVLRVLSDAIAAATPNVLTLVRTIL